MASSYMAFQVSCAHGKHSITDDYNHIKSSLFHVIKPFSRALEQASLQIDVMKTIRNTSAKTLDAFVDSVFEFVDLPLLPSQSNFAPVDELVQPVSINCLNIEGKIPDEFPEGVYVRNGSNPIFGGLKSTKSVFGTSSHLWIEGEGMLHALYFSKDKQGNWSLQYNNRHVKTETFNLEKERNKPCFLPAARGNSAAVLSASLLNMLRFGKVLKDMSNTAVFEHSGKLYSIAENDLPQEIDIFTLETLGQWDACRSWTRPFTSHPKKAPGSGELVIFGIEAIKPFFELGVISADGKELLHKVDLKLDRCSYGHDIGITQRYNVIMDFPLTIDTMRVVRGGPLIKYNGEDYARIGVMPRFGDANSIRWFQVEPNCTFHIINCYEDGDEVVMLGCRSRESIVPGPELGKERVDNPPADKLCTRAYEWRLNMRDREVREKNLTGIELSMDFPLINGNFTGLKNRFGYTHIVDSIASSISGVPKFCGLAKLHFDSFEEHGTRLNSSNEALEETIKVEYNMFGKNTFCTGASFVSKNGGVEEDDGWIITFVHNEDTNISHIYVIDTNNFSSEPVVKITLPCRVPYGFHGAFVPILSHI